MSRALVLAALVGCGDDARAPAPTWLEPYLRDVIGDLAATPRASSSERDATRIALINRLAQVGWNAIQQTYPGGANVYAVAPATAGNEPGIVIGAHFDTVPDSPGANDNASGVAVVLAVARYLADVPLRSAPVYITFFDQEEVGLLGSRSFAQRFSAGDIAAVHTIDQVGWDGDGDHTFELEQPTEELEAAWRDAASVLGARIVVTAASGTDHVSFRTRGFAAVGLTEEYTGGDTSPYRHMPGDTPDTVELSATTLAAQLAARVVIDAVAP